MKESWSNDIFKLAIVALRATIRDETDVAELFSEPPPRKPSAAPAEIPSHVAA